MILYTYTCICIFTKYLKESCQSSAHEHFSFKNLPKK